MASTNPNKKDDANSACNRSLQQVPQLLKQSEVSEIIRKSEAWLERARWSGIGGPAFIKIGRSVRYSLQDVLTWLDQQPHGTSTSQVSKEVDQ